MSTQANNPNTEFGSDFVKHPNKTESSVQETDDVKVFVTGAPHGVNVHLQFNDDNALYMHGLRTWQNCNGETDATGHSDHPFALGELNASWTKDDEKQTAAMFSKEMHYGRTNDDGTWTQYNSYHLNLYDDVTKGSRGIANNPAKRKVILHKRSPELTYEDGNDFTWPEGWATGKVYDGTCMTIQASFTDDLNTIIEDAIELLAAVFGKGNIRPHVIGDGPGNNIIDETIRFDGLEVHHRFDKQFRQAAVDTLRNSSRLVATGGEAEGKEKGEIEKGHYKLWAFASTRLDDLGFDDSISYTYTHNGEEVEETITDLKHFLKVYEHQKASDLDDDHALSNPKMEAKLYKAHPAPAWDAVVNHLNGVLNAHMDWAGIEEDALIEDDWYRPRDDDGLGGETIETVIPTSYKKKLQEYFKSDGLKKTVIGMIFNRQTMSAHDILHLIVKEAYNDRISYDRLADATGLSKSAIAKHLKKFENIQIIERDHRGAAGSWATISKYAKKHVDDLLDKLKTHGEFREELRERKKEREKDDDPSARAKTAYDHADESETGKDKQDRDSWDADDREPTESTWTPLELTQMTGKDVAYGLIDGLMDESELAIRSRSS